MSFRDQFAKLGIDAKTIRSGEVWALKDVKVLFPGRDEALIPDQKVRYVLVFQNPEYNDDALIETIMAMPITTAFGSAKMSLTLEAGEGGLSERSQLKAAFIQPLRKIDLERKLGALTPERFEQVEALVAKNLGLF